MKVPEKKISLIPDVCKSPTAPVPYPIVGKLDDSVRYSQNVNFAGKQAMTMDGRVSMVTGDEAGVGGGGGKSNVNKGYCKPITHSSTVCVNGHHVLYHNDTLMWMNCQGPDGPGNTIGKLIYQGVSRQASISPNGQVPPADPPVCVETPQEQNFLNNLGKRLLNPQGVINLLQKGQQLAKMDWSNPGAVLGAVGEMAGLTGLDPIAKVAGLATQGYNLSQADWSNPATILGTVGTVAGAGGLVPGPVGKIAGYVGNAAGVAQKLVQTDWNNPGSILGAAANLAGLGQLVGAEVGQVSQLAGNLLGAGANVFGRGPLVERLVGLSENLWQASPTGKDANQLPPTINSLKRLVGELNPKTLPETDAEKWGMLSQTTHRVGKAVFDASLPERLAINEIGGNRGEVRI